MRIAVDATALLLQSAGVKSYLYYWLSALSPEAERRDDKLSCYPPGFRLSAVLDHQKTSGRSSFGLRLVQFCDLVGSPPPRMLVPTSDIFHASQHMARRPRVAGMTATVFDMSCWTVPGMHTAANNAATYRYGANILKSCEGLIAISEHARRDAGEILGIPLERIRVVYPGVAEAFFAPSTENAGRIRAKYGLASAYLLFVGCIEPRKNIPGLIAAYRRLPQALRREVQLVVAGPFGWAAEDVRRMLSADADNIRYLGYVPEDDMPGLFFGASALVYPSYYEGFGLPVAQALAAGVPVIASNRTSLPEVVGDAGLLVDPDSPGELSAAMEQIVTCPGIARELAERGKVRARTFHWSRAAVESLDFFHEVAG
jgi:glycosyltransferase involved in cell wall biosynthesis